MLATGVVHGLIKMCYYVRAFSFFLNKVKDPTENRDILAPRVLLVVRAFGQTSDCGVRIQQSKKKQAEDQLPK